MEDTDGSTGQITARLRSRVGRSQPVDTLSSEKGWVSYMVSREWVGSQWVEAQIFIWWLRSLTCSKTVARNQRNPPAGISGIQSEA